MLAKLAFFGFIVEQVCLLLADRAGILALALSASRQEVRAGSAGSFFGVVLLIADCAVRGIWLAGIAVVLISSAGTAFPSKDVILIRRASLAYSVNVAGAAVRDIITHDALLEYLIEVVILGTDIAGAVVLAL